MENDEVESAISDLKSEFLTRTGLKLDKNDLKLKFAYRDHFLYVYHVTLPDIGMITAIYNPKFLKWKLFFPHGRKFHTELKRILCQHAGTAADELNRQLPE